MLLCVSVVPVGGVFAGNRFWVFKDTTLQPTYPQDISLFGSGMPTQSIETAVWWEDVAKTYFFKGDRCVSAAGRTESSVVTEPRSEPRSGPRSEPCSEPCSEVLKPLLMT